MGQFADQKRSMGLVRTYGMLGVCVRFSAALGREVVLAYTAPSLAASCCLHRVLLVMLCASAASCQLKRLCWLRCLRKRMVPISTWRASGRVGMETGSVGQSRSSAVIGKVQPN